MRRGSEEASTIVQASDGNEDEDVITDDKDSGTDMLKDDELFQCAVLGCKVRLIILEMRIIIYVLCVLHVCRSATMDRVVNVRKMQKGIYCAIVELIMEVVMIVTMVFTKS